MTRTKPGKLLAALLAILMLVSLTVPALAETAPDEAEPETLKIAVLSDIHYMSPTMIADTEDFTTALNSDRKLLTESAGISDYMLDLVRKDKPDILLISGDLTKDGEQECHEALANNLKQLQKDVPGLKIYLINGNHDVRNQNGKNFNTADGKAVPATRTEPQDFRRIYDFVYSDETVVANFTPVEGKESGQLSYVARPCDGITLVAIDTCCYSADNNSKELQEHETRGEVSPELRAWVTAQCKEAKQRGDLVIGLSHHGLVPHFSMEPTLLSMYLIEDYEEIAAEWTDAGMQLIFTGHMHANDIAMMTTKSGSTLYDIETGSGLTYPCPMRRIELVRMGDTAYLDISTMTHAGPISYTDPLSGETKVISDLTEYARAQGFSEDMLCTVAGSFLGNFLNKLNIADSKVIDWVNGRILDNIQGIVRDVVNIPITDGKNLLDVVNYIYQSHLGGEDKGVYPAWVQTGLDMVENGQIVDEILSIVKRHAFGSVGDALKFDNIFTQFAKDKLSQFILKVADSMGNDTNYRDDNETVILLTDFPFTDVDPNSWYFPDVVYVTEKGLFNGTSETTFSPNGNMTRAQFVTVLYRMEGCPDVSGMTMNFADVPADHWAHDAILWGYNTGVIKGFTDTRFAPGDFVTREQYVTMLYRYCGSPDAEGSLSVFRDASDISAFAQDAVIWGYANGIVKGYADGRFSPSENTSRAQMAVILHRFMLTQDK